MHAVEFLKAPPADVPGVVALPGDQRLLKRRCVDAIAGALLGGADDPSRVAGETADLRSVLDELRTVGMFAAARVVVVEGADSFVTRFRSDLENYVAAPAAGSALILDVGKWPKSTRLAKAVAKTGLTIDCAALKPGEAAAFLVRTAQAEHGTKLPRDAAALMVELAGTDLGLLEQELGKVAAFVADRSPRAATAEDVSNLVGGWKAKTTFEMLARVRRGDLGAALAELDKLLLAGEAPMRILGGITYSLRKVADAVDLSAGGGGLPRALATAGVFPKERKEVEGWLRALGRGRAERFRTLLLSADGDLRGGAAVPDRTVLERLLVELTP